MPTAPTTLDDLRTRYPAAQLAGDRREALRLIVEEGAERRVPVSALHLEVIRPAQVEIGRPWQENPITVADEPLATAISQLVVSHLYRYLPPAALDGRRVIVSCADGELHEMGARMAADFLERVTPTPDSHSYITIGSLSRSVTFAPAGRHAS